MDRLERSWPNAPLIWGPQSIDYPRIVFYEEADFAYEISLLQPAPGKLMYFAHIYIWDFKPSTLRRIKSAWQAHRPRMPRILYAQGDVTDDKWVRWVRMFGFQPLIENVPCTDGEFRHIYVNFRSPHGRQFEILEQHELEHRK